MSDSTKPTTRRATKPRALRPGDSDYDGEASRELQRRTSRIHKLRVKADELLWRQGLELLVIRDKRLYRQAGFSSFVAWVLYGLGRSRKYAYTRIHVAEAYVLKHVQQHGLDLLEDANRYAALTATDDDAEWTPESLVVRVPVEGEVHEVPFRKATAADLEGAIAHQLELKEERELRAIPEPAKKAAEQIRGVLQVAQTTRSLADVRVRRGETGLVEDTKVTLNLRYGDLRSVILQLARALLGTADPARGRP